MGFGLAVDLGTTHTAAAIVRGRRVEPVSLGTRSVAVPTVLFLRGDGDFLVGEAARRRGTANPQSVVRGSDFKRRIGDDTPLFLSDSAFRPSELIRHMLAWVVTFVTDREGESPSRAVVTCPATWGEYRRGILGSAAADVFGLDVEILEEPVAAAVHYAAQERVPDGAFIGVFDFGGGTLDATVLQKTSTESFEIKGDPGGNAELGGEDLDDILFAHLRQTLGERWNSLDLGTRDSFRALSRLRADLSDAKEALSSDTHVDIPVALPGLNTMVRVTRGEFETLVRDQLESAVQTFATTVHEAHLASSLDRILLSGGSSRIPLVSQLLRDQFDVDVSVDTHPKLAVCLGAALTAGDMSENTGREVTEAVTGQETTTVASVADSPAPPHDTDAVDAVQSESLPPSKGRRRAGILLIAVLALGALIAGVLVRQGSTSVGDEHRVAFVSNVAGDENIYVAGPDGTDIQQLTSNVATDWHPAWSPDGERIAFASDRDGAGFRVYVMDANGEDLERLTSGPDDLHPNWSLDGRSIVFTNWSDESGSRDLYVLDLETGAANSLPSLPSGDIQPIWVPPEGVDVMFASILSEDDVDIYQVGPEDAAPTRLEISSQQRDLHPAVSSDGEFVAIQRNPPSPSIDFEETSVIVLDSQGVEVVLPEELDGASLRAPNFSPDGTSLAVERASPDGSAQILTFVLGDRDATVHEFEIDGTDPAWFAPTGS